MGKVIKIKKGKNINLVGEAPKEIKGKIESATYAVKPTDFVGVVPKMEVKPGAEVKAGTPLFHDKANESIKFTSPVSGEVVDVVRGERRAILEVKILADKETSYEDFGSADLSSSSREDVVSKLKASGLWPSLRQRPFNTIADSEEDPKAIFISGFNSGPLAANVDFTLAENLADFNAGIEVLQKLTSGKIHLGLDAGNKGILEAAEGVEKHYFSGPHPAGLVGIQIHHIDPINKGEVAWTVKPVHVAWIGRLFSTGKYDTTQRIAIGGSEVPNPGYFETVSGCSLENVLESLNSDNVRTISGDVLTGTAIDRAGYLGFYDDQVTVIPEGDDYEFLGWLIPTYSRPTISNTFPISKFLKKKFKVNTNMHGEERAFVVTGQYEKVLPMDILPVQLLKSIMAQDFEKMENLGIYEVVEEDLALCEFVCTSKIEVQKILREGLDLMKEEG